MNQIVLLVFLLGATASCVLFFKVSARQAVITTLIGGWALLPVAPYPESLRDGSDSPAFAGLAVPPSVFLNKATVIGAAVLLGVLLFDRKALERFRPRWLDAPVLLWCLAPLASAVFNELAFTDGLIAVLHQALAWGGPWVVGRVYLGSAGALDAFARALVVAGLVYVPLCLIEVITGPMFYELLYGFHPYQEIGIDRYLGYRPMVWLEDGNQLGMWMASSALAATWLWYTKGLDGWQPVPAWTVATVLIAMTLLCQSVGSIVLLGVGLAMLFASSRIGSRRFVVGAIGVAVVYVVLQASGVIPIERIAKETKIGQTIKSAFEKVGRGSFGWRLKLEEEYVGLARQRPIFGWGDENWWRQQSDTRPWGLWLLTLGRFGLVGLGALVGMLLWPCVLMIWRCSPAMWRGPPWRSAAFVLVLLVINLGDALLNSTFVILFAAAAGGLATCITTATPGLGHAYARGKADRDRPRDSVPT